LYGGTSQGFTTYDTTSYQLVVNKEYWSEAADLLIDALFFSSMDPEEFKKELQVVLRELKMGKDDPELDRKTLDSIIEQELNAQRALALGLELDTADQIQIKARQAEVDAITRSKLSSLFVAKELVPAATPSDEAVRAYFEENRDRLQLEFQVGRILQRTESENRYK